MARKGDNIRRRADGRWEGRYIKGYADGQAKYRSVYGKSRGEVKGKMRKAPPLEAQSPSVFTVSSRKTFEDAACGWLKMRGQTVKPSSMQCYEQLLKTHILPVFGGEKLTAITTKQLSLYFTEKITSGRMDGKGGLSQNTVRSLRFIVGSVLQYAVREGMLAQAPALPDSVRYEKYQPRLLSKWEQNRLLSFLSEHLTPESVGITLCLYSGLRLGEVCALRWEQVDFVNGTIQVEQTLQRSRLTNTDTSCKTSLTLTSPKSTTSKRVVPLPTFIVTQLKTWYQGQSATGYVIGGSNPMEPRTFQNRFKRCLQSAGIGNFNVHALRHTYATRCIEAGLDPKTVSVLLGHSSVKLTLDKYVHPSLEQKQAQVQRLEMFLS